MMPATLRGSGSSCFNSCCKLIRSTGQAGIRIDFATSSMVISDGFDVVVCMAHRGSLELNNTPNYFSLVTLLKGSCCNISTVDVSELASGSLGNGISK